MTQEQLVEKFLQKPNYIKNGAGFLAQKWGTSIEEIKFAKKKIKKLLKGDVEAVASNYIADLENEVAKITNGKMNYDTGEEELTAVSSRSLSPQEIEKLAQVDNIVTFVSTHYLKGHRDNTWTYTILVRHDKKKEEEKNFRDEFKQFLLTFTPSPVIQRQTPPGEQDKTKISLLLPKQDAHYDKYDIYGKNDIDHRFKIIFDSTDNFLRKAEATNYLEEVIYIVGSDQFNCEWTGLTTKGTPQQNLMPYQGSFLRICDHEVGIITMLQQRADRVKVIFIPGNHDEYVGWHIIQHLQTYFRMNDTISFNTSTENTKYIQYGNTAVMLNHGDVLKPKDLAQRFPMGFREGWSSCKYFYIITGDKHHEMSLDIQGIKFYQVPQLSKAKSRWDDKNDFQGYAENTAFVFTEKKGMSDILKDLL